MTGKAKHPVKKRVERWKKTREEARESTRKGYGKARTTGEIRKASDVLGSIRLEENLSALEDMISGKVTPAHPAGGTFLIKRKNKPDELWWFDSGILRQLEHGESRAKLSRVLKELRRKSARITKKVAKKMKKVAAEPDELEKIDVEGFKERVLGLSEYKLTDYVKGLLEKGSTADISNAIKDIGLVPMKGGGYNVMVITVGKGDMENLKKVSLEDARKLIHDSFNGEIYGHNPG
jgi:hypothetical protein